MGIPAHSPCGAFSSTPHRRRQGFEELTGSCRCAAHRLGPRRCARGLQAALLKGFREHAPLTPTLTPQGRGSGRRLCFLPCGTGEVYRGDALRCAASALSPLRPGALRSAWKYPLCGGGGCQATTFLNRSGISPRNATSLRFKPSWHRRVAKRTEVPAVWRRRLPSNTPPQPLGLIPAECCQL